MFSKCYGTKNDIDKKPSPGHPRLQMQALVPDSVESQCSTKDVASDLAVDVACLSEDVPASSKGSELPHKLLASLWKVCRDLMPGWEDGTTCDVVPEGMVVKQISGGITNMLFLVELAPAVGGRVNQVLARVFGAKTELLIDRKQDNGKSCDVIIALHDSHVSMLADPI